MLHEAHGGRGGCFTGPQQRGSRQEGNIFHERQDASAEDEEHQKSRASVRRLLPAAGPLVF